MRLNKKQKRAHQFSKIRRRWALYRKSDSRIVESAVPANSKSEARAFYKNMGVDLEGCEVRECDPIPEQTIQPPPKPIVIRDEIECNEPSNVVVLTQE